jgi:hypothetical protein
MSEEAAAVIEHPKTEQPTRKPLVLNNGIAGMIASLPGNKPLDKKEDKKEESKAPTPVAEVDKKEDKKPDPVTPPVVDDKEKNFATLRQAREAAEKERDELRQKYEASQKEIETYKVRVDPEEVAKERQTYEERVAALRKELQAAAIWRDPEFQQKYDGGILARQKQMIAIAQATGVDATTATAHVQAWDKSKFNEWVEGMPELQKGEFIAMIRETEHLDKERQAEIANADKTWQARQEQQTKAQKEAEAAQRKLYSQDANDVISELTSAEGVSEHQPLVEAIKSTVSRALPINDGHMSRKEVLKAVGLSAVLQHIATAQQEELTSLRTEKEDMAKKITELEAFVKERNGSIPAPGNGVGPEGKSDEPFVPFYKRIRVAGT